MKFHSIIAIVIIFFAAFFCLMGIKWGLPGNEIKKFSMSFREIPQEYIKNAWQISKEKQDQKLPRSIFNPIRSFHPDEQNILKSIASMSVEKFDFNPHFFEYPSAQIYLVAITLKILSSLNLITLKSDIGYYFEHPEEMSKIYLAGRMLTVMMAIAALTFFIFIATCLCGKKGGIFAAACLGLSPLYIINSHYMTVDIPMVFWIIASLFFSILFLMKKKKYLFVLAAFSAGVACGTKYPGGIVIFILPFFYKELFQDSRKKLFQYFFLSLLIFLLAFFITTPYSLLSFSEFKRDILYQAGCRGISSNIFFNFIKFFADATGGLWAGSFLISPIFLISIFFQMRRRNLLDRLILSSIVLSMVPLMASGGFKYARYYLLILPFLCLSAGCIFEEFFRIRNKNVKFLLISISLIFLLGMVSKTAAYSILMSKKDIRIIAAEFFDTSVPENSNVIFTKDPWIFEVPPVNQVKYKINVVEEDKVVQVNSGSFLVIGELQYFLTSGNRNKLMNEKIQKFQSYGFILKQYFEKSPCIGRINYDQGWTIHDMIYTHPRIFVFYKP
ncbi:MAG: glycosyltransferase family 39 protein [Candidatus Omnitrophica bacterium]|nr:glycosyltransferase family 39 protein [Candidatus Omnitrophota bacterium]